MTAFKPVQQYKIAIAATASVAQKINELDTIRAMGKHPVLRVAALASHAIVKVGTTSAVSADASQVDIVTNGTFGADTDWTKGAGWTIAAGVATATGAISTALSQIPPLLRAGYSYLTSFVATRAAGSVKLSVGGTDGAARSTSATFTETIVAGSSGVLAFTGTAFTGTVDTLTCIPNLIPDNSFLVVDAAPAVDIAVANDVNYLSTISEDETDTGFLHVTVGYYQ